MFGALPPPYDDGPHFGSTYEKFFALAEELPKTMGFESGLHNLRALENLARTSFLLDEDLEEVLATLDFRELPENLQSFVSYYQFRSLTKSKQVTWANKARSRIEGSSYWGHRLQLDEIIETMANKDIGASQKALEDLINQKSLDLRLSSQLRWHLSRVYYTNQDYIKADQMLDQVQVDHLRDQAQLFLERAWTTYHKRDYPRALGYLESLKTPYFSFLASNEPVYLEGLIYRDLCQYRLLKALTTQYLRRHGPFAIRLRRGQFQSPDQEALRLLLQTPFYRPYAMAVFYLRQESERAKDAKNLKRKEMAIQNKIATQASQDLRRVANEYLKNHEQIEYLLHIASLEKRKIEERPDVELQGAQMPDPFSFQKLAWPKSQEVWVDELSKYQVFTTSLCKSS